MKKTMKSAFIWLMMVAVIGFAGVANAATAAGTYNGTLADDATGALGSMFFTSSTDAFAGYVFLPDTVGLQTNGGGFGIIVGTISAAGDIAAKTIVGGVEYDFVGALGDPDPTTDLFLPTGTYASADGTVTGTWTAAQQNAKLNKGVGAYFGTFQVNSSVTGHAFTGFIRVVVENTNPADPIDPGAIAVSFTSKTGLLEGFSGHLTTQASLNPDGTVKITFVSPAKFTTDKDANGIKVNANGFGIDGTFQPTKAAGKLYFLFPGTTTPKQVGTWLAARP